MESLSLLINSESRWSTYAYLTDFRQISPVVQTHLKQVYLALCCAIVASAVGVYLHILWKIGCLFTNITALGCMIWLKVTPAHKEKKKVSLLMATSLLLGASIGPLIQLAIKLDPSILVSATMVTAIVFACFSGAAMLTRRRVYLYLGGLLSSGFSIILFLKLASLFFTGSPALHEIELYFGLLVVVGFIVFDTQEIIEKAHAGDLDYVKHAFLLLLDFTFVFVSILIIMIDNEESRRKKKRRRSGNIFQKIAGQCKQRRSPLLISSST